MKKRISKNTVPRNQNKEALLKLMREKFDSEVKSIEQGEDLLYSRLALSGSLRCKKCLGRDFVRTAGTRKIACVSCKHRQSFTSGTFFNRMRRESTLEYLFLISLMENGISVNASEFERHSSVCYSTSLNMIKKSGIVITRLMANEPLEEIHCTELKEVVKKRSRETPARQHPRLEQKPASGKNLIEPRTIKKTVQNSTTGEIISISLMEEHSHSFDQLSPEQQELFGIMDEEAMAFDHLWYKSNQSLQRFSENLSMVEIAGFLFEKGAYIHKYRSVIPTPKVIGADLDPNLKESATTFITDEYQGISQKALQLYLSFHWYHSDREFWREGRFTNAIFSSPPITNKEVLSYVSPQVLQVAGQQASHC